MLGWSCVVVVLVAASVSATTETQRDVVIAQGPVRGHLDDAGEVFGFYNIPYATAPSGDHKFRGPLPPPTWNETFDAVDKGIVCPQMFFKFGEQEQCLVANVFVPANTTATELPVVIYVHGGSFQGGFGNWLKLKKLMRNNNMIVVNFNYRLGVHGFLCLGTEDAPGNAGLKDQVALLRWVQQNIGAFGGNSNDVTLAGVSAGSTSVDVLMLLESTNGLFHKLIPESGSSLSVYAVQINPIQNAKDFAKLLNFTNTDDLNALETFYKGLSYEAMTSIATDNTDNTFMFSLCIEPDTAEALLTEPPVNILKRGKYKKIPMLYGFANMEGLVRAGNFDDWKGKMNEKFADFLPGDLKFDTDAEKDQLAEQVKQKYFGNQTIDYDTILGFIDFSTDVLFAYAHLRAVKLHVEAGHNQVYLYQFSFTDENTPVVPHTDVRGAEHCAQSLAISDGISFIQLNEEGITEEYRIMKEITREFWRNFILTGKPVPEGSFLPMWPAANANRSPYMELDQKVELGGALLEDRAALWDAIYDKHYKEPLVAAPSSSVRLDHTLILYILSISVLLMPLSDSCF